MASREGRKLPVAVIVGIVAAIVAGCAVPCAVAAILTAEILPLAPQPSPTASPLPSPTPTTTPGVSWIDYNSVELGVSVRYPQDWFVKEDLASGYVLFAEREEDLQVDTFLRGTSFAVGPAEATGMATAEELLEWSNAALPDVLADSETGQVEPARIGEEEGARVAIEGESEGVRLRGWIAAVVAREYAFMLVGVAPVEDWEKQGPLLQAMLDSVRLSRPVAVIVTPPAAIPTPPPIAPTPTAGTDAYEPDDSIGQARPITADGAAQRHNFHQPGDHDYVSFHARTGQAYTIETFDLGADIDTVIYLYDEREEEQEIDDDSGDELLASRLIWVPPDSGTYYVMIRDLGEDCAAADAAYSLRVTTGDAMEGADRYEPDDTIARAVPLDTDGGHQTHTFHLSADVDYVAFTAEQGVEYTIETGGLQGGCDPRISLYDEAGQELDYDDDSGPETLASRLVWTPSATGTYYVMTEEFSGRAGPDVSYDIWVSR